MKLDKNLLKSIVKECLVEILAEGIVNNGQPTRRKKQALTEAFSSTGRSRSIEGVGTRNNSNTSSTRGNSRPTYLDNISFGSENNRSERHENAVSKITKSITNDELMQDILADTARTTLQEQISGEGPTRGGTPMLDSRPADKAAEIVSKSDPDELFGGSAKNWATLAFS